MSTASGHARRDHLATSGKVNESHRTAGAGANSVTIAAFQSRTSHYDWGLVRQNPGHAVQPGPAVAILQGCSGPHLGHVLRRVQVIPINIGQTQMTGDRQTDRRLAATRHAHNDHAKAHRAAVRRPRPNRQMNILPPD